MQIPIANLRDKIRGFHGLGSALKIALLVSCFVLAGSFLIQNRYQSDARILPSSDKSAGALGALADLAGLSAGGSSGADQNYEDILKSDWLGTRLLKTEFDFHARSWAFGAWTPKHQSLYEYLGSKNMDSALDALGSSISATRDFKSQLLTISAVTQSPDLSQALTRRAVELLNEFLVDGTRVKGGRKAIFCKERLGEAKEELKKAEDDFRRFLEINRNYPDLSDPRIRLQGSHLETELKMRQQIAGTLAINLEQSLLDEKDNTPLLVVLDQGNLPENKSWPSRGKTTILIFMLVTLSLWAWGNRGAIKEQLFPGSGA